MLTPLNQQLDQSTAPAAPPMGSGAMPPPPSDGSMPPPPMSSEGPTMAKQPFNNPNPPPSPGMAPAGGIGQQMAAHGRGPDSMLVHMAPSEVKGLQALAQSQGGSLTINPTTGLPEAGILSSLLPMIIGAVLTPLTGGLINPMTAGLLVGAGTGLIKHDLGAGLMAGLSAYGGAGLGAALFGGGATAGALFGSAGNAAKTAAAKAAMNVAVPAATTTAATTGASLGAGAFPAAEFAGSTTAKEVAMQQMLAAQASREAALSAAPVAQQGLMGAAKGIGSSFAENLHQGVPGIVPKMVTTGLGTTGLMSGLSGAMSAGVGGVPANASAQQGKVNYLGPYKPVPREYIPPEAGRSPTDSSEHQWFDNVNPGYTTADGGIPPGYPGGPPLMLPPDPAPKKKSSWFADGGLVALRPGGFVVDAETTAKVGGADKLGGKTIRGPGTGTSDSIPARIGGPGGRPARVSNGEALLPPERVKKIGKGDPKRGAQKLYALMDQAKGRAA